MSVCQFCIIIKLKYEKGIMNPGVYICTISFRGKKREKTINNAL